MVTIQTLDLLHWILDHQGVDPLQVSAALTLLLFQTGLDISSILSAKKKLEAKRKRHEKKEAKRAKKAAKELVIT